MSRSISHDQRNIAFREAFFSAEHAKKRAQKTSVVVEARAKDLGLEHQVEAVPDSRGAKLHWLGDRGSEKVILYFHG